ncbi:MAG TPA: right-handed parallel beta-helix repeat-containing protein, partial [Nitrospiraceae bacterium]|nr:right-handed parallel beta-helix repeat-containing protein [Nitrospiraceae bacterium]
MKRILFIALPFGCLLLVGGTGGGITQPAVGVLPGSRATIDAAEYPSLQAALDALPAEGGLVRFPAGLFKISAPLRITRDDVCLEGAGTATHIQNENADGQPAILVAHPECRDAQADRQHQLWRIRLANFRVTGNEKSGPGIEARQINEVFVDGVTVSNHGGDGVLLNYCYEDPRVTNCLITYNKATGVNLQGCHDIVVSANQFEENQDALHCLDGFNLCMTGNCVDDHLGHGVVIENTYGSVVSGNMIEECNGTAIVLDRDCYGNTLSANVIAHNGGGIDLRDAHGCAVSANTFTILRTNALRIGPASGRITVGANNFCNSYVGDNQVRRGTADLAAAGLVLDGAQDIAISGNVFSGLTDKALTVTGEPHGIIFSHNLLRDVTSDHEQIKNEAVESNLV